MNRNVALGVGLVLGIVVTLTGCLGVPPEERFWNEINKDSVLVQVDRATVLAAGQHVCEDLRAGKSLSQIRSSAELSGIPSDQVTRLYSATAYICDDFFDELKGITPG